MARPLMYQTRPWLPVELTWRCQQARFLLLPGEECNRRLLGVLGRAEELYGEHVRLHMAGGTSNHIHIVASFRSAEWKARWKCHVRTNISKELGDLYDWRGTHWEGRSRDIHILDDAALEQRLVYAISHGVKDGLVRESRLWPGVQWLRAAAEGRPLRGVWYDRSRLDGLRRAWQAAPPEARGRAPHLMDVAETKRVTLHPPAAWDHMSPDEVRDEWRRLAAVAAQTYPPPEAVLGADAVLKASPHAKPAHSKRSPAPGVHTADRRLRQAWVNGYAAFADGYRRALVALRNAAESVDFPFEGCRPVCLLPEPCG